MDLANALYDSVGFMETYKGVVWRKVLLEWASFGRLV